MSSHSRDEDSDSDDSDIAFASIDFTGVNFDEGDNEEVDEEDKKRLEWERNLAFHIDNYVSDEPRIVELVNSVANGEYSRVLRTAGNDLLPAEETSKAGRVNSVAQHIRSQVFSRGATISACIEMELVAISALNLFLQINYTGPSMDDIPAEDLDGINPHRCFKEVLHADEEEKSDPDKEEKVTETAQSSSFQNSVLAELAVEGYWPSQICRGPYFLLLARCILGALAEPKEKDWFAETSTKPSSQCVWAASQLSSVNMWHARALVAHERLLQSREPSSLLWKLADQAFQKCRSLFIPDKGESINGSRVMLEYGLAQHHFNQPGNGRASFWRAKDLSGLQVEVTGVQGKRTKFQQKATAQLVVHAVSASENSKGAPTSSSHQVKGQMIGHTEESILLERIQFETEKENKIEPLAILDQAILMALCLDVKNSNPADGLTSEEMGAFLARVLDHHDDWMVYSTALLERSWVEFERSHARERSILQMQALADQHTNRLTLTQSTTESIEESANVQDRLKNIHSIVYPPRWLMLQNLADKYASLGIVTSAAELYAEIEEWDDVVDCYRRAGKISMAEKIVRERLAVQETPRMWSALGDLTNDPVHFEKAIELSNGRYADAFVALGQHYFDKGQLVEAAEHFEKALKVRPLSPATWFRLGTISMQLGRWDTALRAFSEVVTQEPEEHDAWGNVAAIHMRNKKPAEAYPALVQSLKYGRNNWKVWISKLYTCLDLEKYDEAIQACNMILDQRDKNKAAEGVHQLEERCVRAIVGGALKKFHESSDDEVATDAARRTLSRVHSLLERLSESSDVEPWVFETMAFLHEQAGDREQVLEHLMKEYRALQAVPGWEKDTFQIKKVCDVVLHASRLHVAEGSRESLTKARFLLRGVVAKVNGALADKSPEMISKVQKVLDDITETLSSL